MFSKSILVIPLILHISLPMYKIHEYIGKIRDEIQQKNNDHC